MLQTKKRTILTAGRTNDLVQGISSNKIIGFFRFQTRKVLRFTFRLSTVTWKSSTELKQGTLVQQYVYLLIVSFHGDETVVAIVGQ